MFRIIQTNIQYNFSKITDWVYYNQPSKDYTTHWFVNNLPTQIKYHINNIIQNNNIINSFYSIFNEYLYEVESIDDMNELYVSVYNNNYYNSDQVFFKEHIDGPFGLFPLCSVYRVLVSCNYNNYLTTHFPEIKYNSTLSTGDIVGFDYNREIHYISLNNHNYDNNSLRIILKLHYLIYPKFMIYISKLLSYSSTLYNTLARYAFIETLQTDSYLSEKLNDIILFITDNWIYIERYIGFINLINLIFFYYSYKLLFYFKLL